jgi:Zn2+/Cd2+-exporting ATPase
VEVGELFVVRPGEKVPLDGQVISGTSDVNQAPITGESALVISTPVSIVAALTRSAREGVLVKGGLFMEAPARLNAVAFDKTDTLTEGQPQVTRLIPLNEHSEEELLIRAAALEAGSNHPLAQAILTEASQRGIRSPESESHQAIPGKGVTGRFHGTPYWLGSHRYLAERGHAHRRQPGDRPGHLPTRG